MNVAVVAKLSDYKLKNTLLPLVNLSAVENIYLVRRTPIVCEKVVCYCPPAVFRWNIVTSELYRILALLYLCATKKADYIIGIHFYFHCVYAALAGLLFQKPFMFSIVENPKLYKDSKVFKWLMTKARKVAVRGGHSQAFLAQRHVNAFVLPDYYKFRLHDPTSSRREYDFIFIGNLVQEKRVDLLLRAFAKLKARGACFRAVIIGRGVLEGELRKTRQELGLSDCVEITGYVDSVFSYLDNARALTLFSETEGLPTVLLEAVDAGLPLIVSDAGDITDFAKDNVNALVVKTGDVDRFADCCYRFLTDLNLRKKLQDNVLNSKKELEKKYSLEHVSAIWKGVLCA